MSDRRITVFRGGKFTTEPAPDWMLDAIQRAEDTDWWSALRAALGNPEGGWSQHYTSNDIGYPSIMVQPTPGGGATANSWMGGR